MSKIDKLGENWFFVYWFFQTNLWSKSILKKSIQNKLKSISKFGKIGITKIIQTGISFTWKDEKKQKKKNWLPR